MTEDNSFFFKVSSDDKELKEFHKLMNEIYESTHMHICELANELGCSYKCASDVWYLRTRSRHTEELEKKLIQLYKEGNPPNIFDWP